MDPPESIQVEAPPRSPSQLEQAPQRRRRGARTTELTLIATISYVILSLFKLESNVRNHSVQNIPREFDSPAGWQGQGKGDTTNIPKKPIFYLHVGPPKTATTTIQAKLFESKDLLSKDEIVFLGRSPRYKSWYLNNFPHVAHCPMYRRYAEKAGGISPDCFSKMNETLQSYYHSGNDLLISDEVVGIMFSENSERSQQALADFKDLVRDWDVRILLGYRPYFDFVTSQFNEQWEVKPSKKKMHQWPKYGGRSVPLVKDSWNNKGLAVSGWSATAHMADFFSNTFDNVTVFDITNPGDLNTHFLCNVLENANQACAAQKALVSSGLNQTRKNVANPLDYDMLATAASVKGLFSLDLKRSHVAKKIRQHFEDKLGLTVRDFPLICPSLSHAMALFNATVAQEKKLFPDKAGLPELEARFQKRLATKAFCNVDVEKALTEQVWIDFFKSLHSEGKEKLGK